MAKWNHTINGKAKRLLYNKRRECEKRELEFDLDEQWYRERLQVGCALTGLSFKLDSNKDLSMSATVDRIDPTKGYVKSNCRLILHCLNAFKGYSTDEDMYTIASLLVERKNLINQDDSISERKKYLSDIAIEKKQLMEAEKNNHTNLLSYASNMLLKNEITYTSEEELLYIIEKYFTTRQLELIHKKYNMLVLTKTENEYYSRVIKKRLRKLSMK